MELRRKLRGSKCQAGGVCCPRRCGPSIAWAGCMFPCRASPARVFPCRASPARACTSCTAAALFFASAAPAAAAGAGAAFAATAASAPPREVSRAPHNVLGSSTAQRFNRSSGELRPSGPEHPRTIGSGRPGTRNTVARECLRATHLPCRCVRTSQRSYLHSKVGTSMRRVWRVGGTVPERRGVNQKRGGGLSQLWTSLEGARRPPRLTFQGKLRPAGHAREPTRTCPRRCTPGLSPESAWTSRSAALASAATALRRRGGRWRCATRRRATSTWRQARRASRRCVA